MEKTIKKSKGITLIALVVTIIVLLILAAVTINLVIGKKGIIANAQKAQSKANEATAREQAQLEWLDMQAEAIMKGKSVSEYVSELSKEEKTAKGIKEIGDGYVVITNDGYDLKMDDNGTVAMAIVSVANTPKVKTESGMKAVRYNNGTWSEANTSEDWYSYEPQTGTTENGGTSEWANAMTPDESMWVWIPRYAYKITKGEHGEGLTYSSDNITTEAGIIDVIFLKGTSNTEYIDKNTGETRALPNGYTVHPAFTTNANEGGGWSQELEGIWVAKFEASSVEGNDETDSSKDNVTTKTLQVKPNVSSWRNIQIGNMYTVAREAKYGLKDETQINNLNSHMMKNSEWGAVAYLAHSKYGRNGTEISINNSSDYYTGRSAGAPGSSSTTTISEGTYEYNNEKGGLASTTGNVYGIYDISGGAWEYLATYINNGLPNISTYGSSFATEDKTLAKSTEFVTVYEANGGQVENYEANAKKKGDAIYETSKSGSAESGWFSDYSYFAFRTGVFFLRGGSYGNLYNTGAFCFLHYTGEAFIFGGFRPVLAVF